MVIKLRNILLKMIPYVLSVAGGLILFIVTKDEVHNPNVTDLINNISASLLSIPLVFLLYDYTNYSVSKQLNKTMADRMTEKINIILLNLIMIIRQMLGIRGTLTFASMNKMSNLSQSKIVANLKITQNLANELRTYRDEIDNMIYNGAKPNVLTGAQVQMLTGLVRELSLLINEHSFRRNRRVAAKYIENIIGKIIDWMDSDAFASMHFQQLLGAAQLDDTNRKSTKSQNS